MISDSLPFEVVSIPFAIKEFNGPVVAARFREALHRFKPDLVFLADGFHLKPWAAQAIGDYPFFVKFYAYENFCLRYNGTFMRGDRSCFRTGMRGSLLDKAFCTLCGTKSVLDAWKNGYRGFTQEFFGARAWSPLQWKRVASMLNQAGAIVVYNRMFQDIIGYCGWKSVVIPGGIDSARFARTPLRRFDGRIRLGLVGRINDIYKGVVTAVRALRLLHARGIDAELHVTGEPGDTPLALPGVVFRGWFTRETIHEFYEAIDICLVPSIWQEPFGIVTLEAMCCGRPVIASRVAGSLEIITDNETGILVPPQSSEEIADAVERYLGDPDFTTVVVNRAAAHVAAHFDWNVIVNGYYLPLIEQILSGEHPENERVHRN